MYQLSVTLFMVLLTLCSGDFRPHGFARTRARARGRDGQGPRMWPHRKPRPCRAEVRFALQWAVAVTYAHDCGSRATSQPGSPARRAASARRRAPDSRRRGAPLTSKPGVRPDAPHGGRAETPLRPLAAAASIARECALRKPACASGTRDRAAVSRPAPAPCSLPP